MSDGAPYEGDELADEGIAAIVDHVGAVAEFQFPVERAKACALGYGWWVGIVRMGEAVRRLYRLGFDHEASPLIRTLLHHTGVLVWLEQEPEVVLAAVKYEHPARTVKLFNHAQSRQWDLSDLVETPEKPSGPPPEGAALLDNFEELSRHIGKPNLYVPYKIESGYVHPSGMSGDTYLDVSDGRVVGRETARAPHTPLRATVLCLVIATDAYADLLGGHEGLHALAADVAARNGLTDSPSESPPGSPD